MLQPLCDAAPPRPAATQFQFFLELCQALINTFSPLPSDFYKAECTDLVLLCRTNQPNTTSSVRKWANITIPVVFCTELWCDPHLITLCPTEANLGCLVWGKFKTAQSRGYDREVADQSDQWCASKCLIRWCFPAKLCKNLLVLQASYSGLGPVLSQLNLKKPISKNLTWTSHWNSKQKILWVRVLFLFFLFFSQSFTKLISFSALWQQDYVLNWSNDFQGNGSFLFGKPKDVPWNEWNSEPLLTPRCLESVDVLKKMDFLIMWSQDRAQKKHFPSTFWHHLSLHHSEKCQLWSITFLYWKYTWTSHDTQTWQNEQLLIHLIDMFLVFTDR